MLNIFNLSSLRKYLQIRVSLCGTMVCKTLPASRPAHLPRTLTHPYEQALTTEVPKRNIICFQKGTLFASKPECYSNDFQH